MPDVKHTCGSADGRFGRVPMAYTQWNTVWWNHTFRQSLKGVGSWKDVTCHPGGSVLKCMEMIIMHVLNLLQYNHRGWPFQLYLAVLPKKWMEPSCAGMTTTAITLVMSSSWTLSMTCKTGHETTPFKNWSEIAVGQFQRKGAWLAKCACLIQWGINCQTSPAVPYLPREPSIKQIET